MRADLLFDLDNSRWGTECWCHIHRDHIPQESHHIWPLGWGGPDVIENRVLICANAHSSVHRLMAQFKTSGTSSLPAPTLRQYGPRVRYLARLGYLASVTRVPVPYPLPHVR